MLVTTGILVAATGDGEKPGATAAVAPPTVLAAFTEPAFFFDDATDALDERRERDGVPREAPAAPPVATGAPRAAGAVLPAIDPIAAPSSSATAPEASPKVARTVLADPATPDHRPTASDTSPPAAPLASGPHLAAPDGAAAIDVVVGPGDTLSGILNDHGVSIGQLRVLLSDEVVATHLSRLRVGQTFSIARLADGRFHSLSARLGHDTRVTIERRDGGFAVAAIELPLEKERVVASGTIDQSLYLAAERAELKQSTIMALADIFQWELDFARDIRQGDRFAVVYDRLYREGRYVGDGDILAAEFERGGRAHRAIRFTAEDGRSGYYAPDGTNKRRTFLRHPVDVVRITSKFDPARLHPVLHQIRAHRGVDYGAPHGSPIRATADGVVRFAGARSTYGNTVILQHGEAIKTLYAHLSRVSDKSVAGARVRQGDVIGYVGNTGRVTGTHLHYEFRVNDKHVDPLTVEFPTAAPLPADRRDALKALSEELIAQMRSVTPGTSGTAVANAADRATPFDVADLLAERGDEGAGSALTR